jgi:hypothetical protein
MSFRALKIMRTKFSVLGLGLGPNTSDSVRLRWGVPHPEGGDLIIRVSCRGACQICKIWCGHEFDINVTSTGDVQAESKCINFTSKVPVDMIQPIYEQPH